MLLMMASGKQKTDLSQIVDLASWHTYYDGEENTNSNCYSFD